jgi:D-sedoheptulose 7-phosphate isomerase
MADPFVREYLSGLRAVLDEVDAEAVSRVIDILWEAYGDGRRIFIIGNGGSAATASHMMCDLVKGCAVEGRPPVRAISLTDNVAVMTAVSNDIAYEKVFTKQMEAFLEAGDVVVAMTVSGNSPNILDAVRFAADHGATTVGLIGFGGGQLKDMVDADVTVASRNYGYVEDLHLVLEHLMSQCLRSRIEAG